MLARLWAFWRRPRRAALALLAACAALLAGALVFQYGFGLEPCTLCRWQRWPHIFTIFLAALGWSFHSRPALALAGIALLGGAAVAGFHVGVEQLWWEGTRSCGAGSLAGLSVDALREKLLATPVVRCDEIAWSLFGVSMAGYNALISIGLSIFALAASRHPDKTRR